MTACRLLFAAAFAAAPAIAVAQGPGQGLSQYRVDPLDGFNLTVIGIVLVVVMIVLGLRALMRRRP